MRQFLCNFAKKTKAETGKMKKLSRIFVALVLSALALSACATLTPAEKKAKEEEKAKMVHKLLNERHYTIEVQMMYPQGGVAQNVASDYSLEVRGDTLLSYLPYRGRAYQVPYGGGKGLNFSARIGKYSTQYIEKKELTKVTIELTNDEDTYLYELSIFDNGRANIDVRAREREPISFSGEIDFDAK